jgi:uroporphyrinogen-III synthase
LIESDAASALRCVRRIAIGAVTAAALVRADLPAHAVAQAPTPEAVSAALLHALRSDGGVC